MRCECQNTATPGYVYRLRRAWTLPGSPLVVMKEVCDACGGSGVDHCCSGDRACPDDKEDIG